MVALTRRTLVASALAVCGATAVASRSLEPADVLVVGDAETDESILEIPVEQGTRVTIAYTHSVHGVPVEDVYVVDGSSLRADRSVYGSIVAGLPADAVERTDEGYVLEGTGSYDELAVVPGGIAGHELAVGDERYDLVSIADGRVVLSVAERSGLESTILEHAQTRSRASVVRDQRERVTTPQKTTNENR